MIVLKQHSNPTHLSKTIILFGVGLIGSNIVDELKQQNKYDIMKYEFPWTNQQKQIDVLQKIEKEIDESDQAAQGRTHIVWSAGQAGFSASELETNSELSSFCTVLDFAKRQATRNPMRSIDFHLISSAGGLFEGKRHITQNTIPEPLRPYGKLKLQQENYLNATSPTLGKHIYRPSSVYGPIIKNHRRGLVPTLILNGVQHQVSQIIGHLSTLRDYVWVKDIAQFIVANMNNSKSGYYLLASGKPTSILEIVKQVENIIRRAIYINYSSTPLNSVDITFSQNALPQTWTPTDLKVNIAQIYNKLRQQGF